MPEPTSPTPPAPESSSEVVELKKSVDAQAAELRTLQQKIDDAARGAEGIRPSEADRNR